MSTEAVRVVPRQRPILVQASKTCIKRERKNPKAKAERARLHSPAVSRKPGRKRCWNLPPNATPFPSSLRNGENSSHDISITKSEQHKLQSPEQRREQGKPPSEEDHCSMSMLSGSPCSPCTPCSINFPKSTFSFSTSCCAKSFMCTWLLA